MRITGCVQPLRWGQEEYIVALHNAVQAQQPVYDPRETAAWISDGLGECCAQDAEDRATSNIQHELARAHASYQQGGA